MNHRIEQTFSQGRAFIAYLTAGDGGIKRTLEAALALIDGGVNMLEIGIPFSDSIADGPVIQRAATRALAQETTLKDILFLCKEIRKHSEIPLILFSYFNPILNSLNSSFLYDAKCTGIDGLLIVDCPIEESETLHQQCIAKQLSLIYVITPTTSLARIKKIDQYGHGFLYYACRKGTTGMRNQLPQDFVEKIKMIKSHVRLPVAVGFGISERQMAKEVLQHADGVVVGSLFVKALEDGLQASELESLARSINPLSR